MRRCALVILCAGSASAGPVARIGVVGGIDATAPGHRDDGLALGLGYRAGWLTAELDYAYLDYDGSSGYGGGATRVGVRAQAMVLSATCRPGTICPHLDFDLQAGRRWVTWQPEQEYAYPIPSTMSAIERQGRELEVGLSATFGWHFALHYMVFAPDPAPEVLCRGTCPMQTRGTDTGLLFEAAWVFGD